MIWKPQNMTLIKINNSFDLKNGFKFFRSSSSAYISNKKVREHVFKKFDYKCVKCNSTENLEIDHIKSVLSCFKSRDIFNCNSIDNLQSLCKKCNTSKKP